MCNFFFICVWFIQVNLKKTTIFFFFLWAAVFLSVSSNPGEQQRPDPQSHPQPNTPLQVGTNRFDQSCFHCDNVTIYSLRIRSQKYYLRAGLLSWWLRIVAAIDISLSAVFSRRSQSPINCIRASILGPIKRKGKTPTYFSQTDHHRVTVCLHPLFCLPAQLFSALGSWWPLGVHYVRLEDF